MSNKKGFFEKGNTYGKGRPRGSKNKRTIAFESLKNLTDVGINPLQTSKTLIEQLVKDTDLKNSDKLNLLSTMTNLFKYQLLTRAEEIRLFELTQENEELKEKIDTFIGTPQDLLRKLEEEN